MSQNAKVISLLEHHSFEIEDKKIILQNVSLSRDNHLEVVKCELLVKEIPTQEELKVLKKQFNLIAT
jgi:hypothetical protein